MQRKSLEETYELIVFTILPFITNASSEKCHSLGFNWVIVNK